MILNPVQYFRLRQEARANNWLTSWIQRCLDDEAISFAGKVQMLSAYYEVLEYKEQL